MVPTKRVCVPAVFHHGKKSSASCKLNHDQRHGNSPLQLPCQLCLVATLSTAFAACAMAERPQPWPLLAPSVAFFLCASGEVGRHGCHGRISEGRASLERDTSFQQMFLAGRQTHPVVHVQMFGSTKIIWATGLQLFSCDCVLRVFLLAKYCAPNAWTTKQA